MGAFLYFFSVLIQYAPLLSFDFYSYCCNCCHLLFFFYLLFLYLFKLHLYVFQQINNN